MLSDDTAQATPAQSLGGSYQFQEPALVTALWCGLLPLMTGTLIYLAWRVTRWNWLMGAGTCTIGLGLIVFFIGIALLIRPISLDPKAGGPGKGLRFQAAIAGSLLFLNFPAATFYVYSVDDILTRTTVDVVNTSESAIDSFVLIGPIVETEMGPIQPGEQVRRYVHARGKGELAFAATQQGLQFNGLVEGYVCSDIGGHAIVRVTKRGVWSVQHRVE